MIVIEHEGKIKFLNKGTEISIKEGFQWLFETYDNQPFEVRKRVKRLKDKYWRECNEAN